MEQIIGLGIFVFVVMLISAANKFQQRVEDERRANEPKMPMENLPEATRRMMYGDTMAPPTATPRPLAAPSRPAAPAGSSRWEGESGWERTERAERTEDPSMPWNAETTRGAGRDRSTPWDAETRGTGRDRSTPWEQAETSAPMAQRPPLQPLRQAPSARAPQQQQRTLADEAKRIAAETIRQLQQEPQRAPRPVAGGGLGRTRADQRSAPRPAYPAGSAARSARSAGAAMRPAAAAPAQAAQPAAASPQTQGEAVRRVPTGMLALFRDVDDLRRGIVMREVLGPPVSMR